MKLSFSFRSDSASVYLFPKEVALGPSAKHPATLPACHLESLVSLTCLRGQQEPRAQPRSSGQKPWVLVCTQPSCLPVLSSHM